MATNPCLPILHSHHLHDPLVTFHPPAPFLGPRGEPPPQSVHVRYELHTNGNYDKMHLRDRLLIIQDLVFDLRQEMADLNYRLQATDGKLASCLQLLFSMQVALAQESVEATPGEATAIATDGGSHSAHHSDDREPAKTEHDHQDEGIKHDEASEPTYKPTYIEEEPFPGDLPPMWPAFSPGV
jgi:hypothetical protein